MNKIKPYRIASLIVAFLLILCSCASNVGSPLESETDGTQNITTTGGSEETEPPQSYEKGSYTLMIYMCGSDLETRNGAATKNIAEMLAAEIPENVSVILQTGGAQKWRDYNISANHSSRYEIRDGKLILLEQRPRLNMGEAQTLSDFLLWGDKNYPAEHRSVILWNHGGGSIKGVCKDKQFFNDTLTLPEMSVAFATAYEACGRKYEFVGFDACLMATYDVACVLEPYAKRMIASEDLEPSSGWPYEVFLSCLGKNTEYTELLKAYGEKHADKSTHTLSVVDLSEMAQLDAVIKAFANYVRYDIAHVKKAFAGGVEFGSNFELGKGTGLFDLGAIAESLGIAHNFSSFIQTQNGETHRDAFGISIYFPTKEEYQEGSYVEICQNETYLQFLSDYFSHRPEQPVAFENPGYDRQGKFSFTLTEDSLPYVLTMGYELRSEETIDEKGFLYGLGYDGDISLQNGVYTVQFNGQWLFMNGIMLHTSVYGLTDDVSVFTTPVKINGEYCYLLFTYHRATQSTKVEGYVIRDDIASRINTLQEGMQITVLYEGFTRENEAFYQEKGTVIWGDSVTFSYQALEPGDYQCIPYVADIYGNLYIGATCSFHFDGENCTIKHIAFG